MKTSYSAAAIVLTAILSVASIWGQGPPAGSAGQTPQLTAPQQTVIDNLASFYGRVRQDAPGQPSGTNLGSVINNWSREVRTITVKVGERFVPRSYPAGAIEKQDILVTRDVTRIYFGSFTGKNESATSAEYDPEFGVIKLKDSLVKFYEPPKVAPPKYGEHNITDIFGMMEQAQTLWHEFHHSTQGRQPGTIENETATWHATLNTTAEWVSTLQQAYQNARTLENARYLLGAIDAWQNYFVAIENKTSEKELNAQAMPAGGLTKFDALEQQIRKEHQAIEILEGLTGPSPVPGAAKTLDEMLADVQATSLSDLEKKLFDTARVQVDQGTLKNHDSARKDAEATKQVKQAIELVRPSWEKRVGAVADAARRLSSLRLGISPAGHVFRIDPATGTSTVEIEVENNTEFSQLVNELLQNLKRATGSTAIVKERWQGTGLQLPETDWVGQSSHQIDVDQAKKYQFAVARRLTLNVDLSSHGLPPTITCKSNVVEVEVYGAYPTEIAGEWTGTFVIGSMPLIDQIAEAAAAEEPGEFRPGSDPLDSLGEGCSIPPETFLKLQKLKGRGMDLTTDIRPASVMSGQMTLNVAFPKEFGTSQPFALTYRYDGGRITASGSQNGGMIQMTATFAYVSNEWTFSGTWQMYGEKKGQRALAMSGTWSGSNASAK